MTHLFLRALGFHYEVQRKDRDATVKINWNNIKPTSLFTFHRCQDCETFDIGYDVASNLQGHVKVTIHYYF